MTIAGIRIAITKKRINHTLFFSLRDLLFNHFLNNSGINTLSDAISILIELDSMLEKTINKKDIIPKQWKKEKYICCYKEDNMSICPATKLSTSFDFTFSPMLRSRPTNSDCLLDLRK